MTRTGSGASTWRGGGRDGVGLGRQMSQRSNSMIKGVTMAGFFLGVLARLARHRTRCGSGGRFRGVGRQGHSARCGQLVVVRRVGWDVSTVRCARLENQQWRH
jgi:hypothetical protein